MKRKTKKEKQASIEHQVPLTVPRTVAQSEIIRRIAESLGGDYAEYEILDILEAAGPVFMQALANYEEFRIRGMGEFTFKIHKPKRYYNVANQRFEFADWTRRPHFEFVRAAKRHINESVKQLHIETLQQPADYVVPDQEQLTAYQKYLEKLGRWSEGKLGKFTDEAMQGITELSTPDEVKEAAAKIEAYKVRLQTRYDRFYADILNKIKILEDKIKQENTRTFIK